MMNVVCSCMCYTINAGVPLTIINLQKSKHIVM